MAGAGAFEIAAYCMLKKEAEKVKGRVKLGVLVGIDSLLEIFRLTLKPFWSFQKLWQLMPGLTCRIQCAR